MRNPIPPTLALFAATTCFHLACAPSAPEPPRPPEDLAPQPFLTSPDLSEDLFGELPIVHEARTLVMAEDLTHEDDVLRAIFEFSDAEERDWMLIGVDDNPEYEGPPPTNVIDEQEVTLSCCVSEGTAGFSTIWETSDLEPAVYALAVTMEDEGGQTGRSVRRVLFEPSPPLLELTPGFRDGGVVRGQVEVGLRSAARGLRFQLAFLQDAQNAVDQRGLGNERQTDIFPVRQGANMYCVPTGAKNSLWRLAANEERFLNVPAQHLRAYRSCFRAHARAMGNAFDASDYYDDGKLTNLGLAVILACKMRTSPRDGTTDRNVLSGLRSFLTEQGLRGAYRASTLGVSFRNFHAGLNRGEDVGVKICYRIRNTTFYHYLTGKDARHGRRGAADTASFVDPATGASFNSNWSRRNTIDYPVQIRRRGTTVSRTIRAEVQRLWTVSPTGSPVWVPIDSTCREDRERYRCSFDSTPLENNFYSFRFTSTDSKGNHGVLFFSLFVEN